MNFLQILKLVLQLLPVVIEAMKTLESVIPEAGKGAQKMALLKETVASVANVAEDIDKKQFDTAFSKAVDLAVGVMKTVGVFKN